MNVAVMVLNFGEPEDASPESVIPYLEKIFFTNASIEGETTVEQARARSRALAERRAPGLIAEYEEIGGSPLNGQAYWQADALRAELGRRGHAVRTYVGMQFTDPMIEDAVARMRMDGMSRVIALPVYPLCGPSTTVAALEQLTRAIRDQQWSVELREISGWHRHPDYVPIWADAIRSLCDADGVDLLADGTRLVFSAHGTPLKYLQEGSRYGGYVVEFCDALAAALGVARYELGYQNHGNRPVEWTRPDIDSVVRRIDAERIVCVPVSFLHEQSETLAELDHELREIAEGGGLSFHRVPVPHNEPRVIAVLADVVEPLLGAASPRGPLLGQCRCRPDPATRCTNFRDL